MSYEEFRMECEANGIEVGSATFDYLCNQYVAEPGTEYNAD